MKLLPVVAAFLLFTGCVGDSDHPVSGEHFELFLDLQGKVVQLGESIEILYRLSNSSSFTVCVSGAATLLIENQLAEGRLVFDKLCEEPLIVAEPGRTAEWRWKWSIPDFRGFISEDLDRELPQWECGSNVTVTTTAYLTKMPVEAVEDIRVVRANQCWLKSSVRRRRVPAQESQRAA
jgi:hypothetical protein